MASTPSFPRFRLVFVIGVAHCGSTLLGRLLDMHPAIFCGGEMMRISRAMTIGKPCACGRPIGECSFWKPLIPNLGRAARTYRGFTRRIYERVRESAGSDLVLDLSKTLAWKRTRWWRRKDVGYLFLIRDSRGILSSSRRAGKEIEGSLRKHRKWIRRLARFARNRYGRVLTVYYEDLAGNPERELRRMTDFLGLPYLPAMLRPADQVHHFIHSSVSGYLKGTNEIRVDERWRGELSTEEIEQITAEMNRIPVLRKRYLPDFPDS
jgi:hypothetical protein